MTHDPATLRFYDRTAPDYIASGPGGTSPTLAPFLAALPPGAHVLELGCGAGRDAQALIAAGHHVTPTDGSPAMAAQAEARLKLPVRTMRFDELDADAQYDAIWSNAALLHVPRPGLPDIIARIHRALRPGGILGASVKGGGQEGRDDEGRYFNYLAPQELRALFDRPGSWQVERLTDYMGGGYGPGRRGPWVAVIARRGA